MRRRLAQLYHLAERTNLASIRTHGLRSTTRLCELAGIAPAEGQRVSRTHRPDGLRLSPDIVIRDQRPMPPAALATALDDGLTPEDWYALLNGFVFLWPDRDRMDRQKRACGDRPQTVMTFDAQALFETFGDAAFVSPINSGNARRKPARRGRDTHVPYRRWVREGWPSGGRTRPPAEILFACDIPAAAPYLIDTADA